MKRNDFFSCFNVWKWNLNMSVKSSWSKKSRIKHIKPVCCSYYNNSFCFSKAWHFSKQRIKSLIFFIVTWTIFSVASFNTDGINFIYKDNCFSMRFCLFKKASHSCCTNTHINLYKIWATKCIKWNSCFTCNCLSEKCFACSRISIKNDSFWHPSTIFFVFFRIFKKVHNIHKTFFCFFVSSNRIKIKNMIFLFAEIFHFYRSYRRTSWPCLCYVYYCYGNQWNAKNCLRNSFTYRSVIAVFDINSF